MSFGDAEHRRAEWRASAVDGVLVVPAIPVPRLPCPICREALSSDEGGWWCDPCGVEWDELGVGGVIKAVPDEG